VIAVTVPTKNSARTLESCLRSVREQDVEVELVVADDRSEDETVEIARSFDATVIVDRLPLLEARYRAFAESRGDPVVLLDSDQVLEPGALRRCLDLAERHELLFLEEGSVEERTWLQALYAADRRHLHRLAAFHADPARGSLLPRVFSRRVLEAAFAELPPDVRTAAVAQDHVLLYEAAARQDVTAAIVPAAVRHHEPDALWPLWRKYFGWGVQLSTLTNVAPATTGSTLSRLRGRLHHEREASLGDHARSLALLALKLPPYAAGYAYGRARRLRRG
jgi:glycosyltransferase involved in cell wall biosynthesis